MTVLEIKCIIIVNTCSVILYGYCVYNGPNLIYYVGYAIYILYLSGV